MTNNSEDDRTIIMPQSTGQHFRGALRPTLSEQEKLDVQLLGLSGELVATYSFSDSFTVGRADENEIAIENRGISRRHTVFHRQNVGWTIENLGSNGTFIHDQPITRQALDFPISVALGFSGFSLYIQKSSEKEKLTAGYLPDHHASQTTNVTVSTSRSLSSEEIKARYLSEQELENSGEYTKIVRKLIHEDRNKRKKNYRKLIYSIGALFFMSICLVTYQQIALSTTRKQSMEMFYDMKMLEVSLSQADMKLEERLDIIDKMILQNVESGTVASLKAQQERIAIEKKNLASEREKLAMMKVKYRQYVKEANSLRIRFPSSKAYEEELIANVASKLGESELELPDEFVSEVRKYIQYLQGSSRMQKAIENLEQNNNKSIIISALNRHGLPLHFFYLPMQESNYDERAIGPVTRFGIAKGAWQLLASTAQEYGITPGPLANESTYDEQDARFDFNKSTAAGTRYLKRIYSSDAQASGLLVMASYNYGDTRVKRLIQKMPDNPRDRNFWKFIQQHQLPKETHDYVFYIFAAAVIGEDPQHFGFKFPPPLLSNKLVNR